VNVLDALAAAAVFVMGEGAEQTPCALIKEAPKITFSDCPPTEEEVAAFTIPIEEDLYGPLFLPLERWACCKEAVES
jgi:F420-0:gamma-glutamyl ligase